MPKNSADTINAFVATLADMLAAAAAVFVAVWIRFDSGWFSHERFGRPDNPYYDHIGIAGAAAFFAYVTIRTLRLYRRPQRGTFMAKIPRLIRASIIIMIALLVVNAVAANTLEKIYGVLVSSGVAITFAPVFFVLLALERGVLFRLEIRAARRAVATNRVLIIGCDATAAHLMRCFKNDPRLRLEFCGVLKTRAEDAPDPGIGADGVLGTAADFKNVFDATPNLVQVIASSSDIERDLLYKIAAECEKRLIRFNIVPDYFVMMTSSVEVETIDDIPLLGIKASPLDKLGARIAKRALDIVGALAGLFIFIPVILVMAVLIKRESRGPVFYRQRRCGYGGKEFPIYKLRSMREDAEVETGAIFAEENDPRRTRIGAWMREHNIDELPQFWNVLKGDMSLVGPRPERPEFVGQFSEGIAHYMRRHYGKPGITGWAQVHGLRGNTSIEERLKYDLWYLANWSVALDFKILLRTIFTTKNAY